MIFRKKTGIERLQQKNKKLSGLDKYLIFSFSVVLIYTPAEFISSNITGVSHDVLTTCIFALFGGEVVGCAIIKKYKLKKRSDDYE